MARGETLKDRAVMFALCAGGVAFFLALLVTSRDNFGAGAYASALIPAIVCATMCWAATQRAVATTAEAIDRAVDRLAEAADGEIDRRVPDEIRAAVPQLATAMDRLFAQLADNLDSIQRLALFDPVTGLANRTNFRTGAERLLAETPRETGALFFIDLDRFKAVNDTHGHACGDMLLAMVADRLRGVSDRAVAEADIYPPLIGRLAGDEFTMLFPLLADPRDAGWIAAQVLDALAAPFPLMGGEASIGASIGIALRPDHGITLHDLMRCADAAMYCAKSDGRGRFELYSDELAEQMASRVRLDAELRDALDRDEFTLVFQPEVSLADGNVVAAEALLRWRHPRDGLRLPGTFIGRAEESGLMVEIGDWVLACIARTVAHWASLGFAGRLAINVSARQIDRVDFFTRLRAAMREAGAPARLLELEINETIAAHARADAIAALAQLREEGATIAIDGFGTGLSSVARLRQLPIDRIKLDRGLIGAITQDHAARVITGSLVGLIHGLGCEAVAEGVETPDQVELLRILGCDAIQGYGVARPMGEEDFLAWSAALADLELEMESEIRLEIRPEIRSVSLG
ncbi:MULTISPECIES: EAL domain-containing protein [unclassified Sphingomonas]|uniref:putative bifunctional diguanylate cyclase/phosphodiesterase n=1 Tax=unclassified Sphingomonas TaxID=196159 RepID=UPI00092CDB6F|nr:MULTISPECIES: EAL domain-containing protein [unclassified Sphingomonas]MBN8848447.1 EAL domain-containing protein [Sphingomonas sp.]MBS0284109.1 EAL domain-containing protein [Pseudomonadota bacterium]OJV32084.1 MAG: GGDEF-domain containing protein [Sphingomonas sp. 67-36]